MTGFVNINKECGVSSAREVARIKRLTSCPCGHMGTLDPMADGVLPIAIGNAARLFNYLLNKSKTYVATFRFGEDYDTLDTTGTVVRAGGRIPQKEEVIDIIPSLCGDVMQIPPAYSAKNINGQRAYKLAREGKVFELQAKKVRIESIELLSCGGCEFVFRIVCGSGTYIRSIAADMAKNLGTYAAMSALTRTASGAFTIEKSVKSEELTVENIHDYIVPCDSVIACESYFLNEREAKKLLNGVAIDSELVDGTYKIYSPDGSFYGLAEVKCGLMRVRTKLC